jgi:hypothetical protein
MKSRADTSHSTKRRTVKKTKKRSPSQKAFEDAKRLDEQSKDLEEFLAMLPEGMSIFQAV